MIWRITAIDYDKYAKKYSEEKTELERKLVEYTNNDKSFIVTSSYLLQLASRAKEVFESSQPEKKNKILRILLANCQINEKRLQLNLLKPFSTVLDNSNSLNWLRTIEEVITIIKRDAALIYLLFGCYLMQCKTFVHLLPVGKSERLCINLFHRLK